MAMTQQDFDTLLNDIKNNRPNNVIVRGKLDLSFDTINFTLNDEHVVALAKALKKNRTVKELNLSNHDDVEEGSIGPKGAKALAETLRSNIKNNKETLIGLDISGNSIGSSGVAALAKNAYV